MPDLEYKVIAEQGGVNTSLGFLEKHVRAAIADGWRPLGGVSVSNPGGLEAVVAQAMTRDRTIRRGK